jgi:hypothetical protein
LPSSLEISTRSTEPSPTQARPRTVKGPFTCAFGAGEVIIDLIGQASADTASGGILVPGSIGRGGTR